MNALLKISLFSAQEGQEYTITMEFGAKPKPGPEELTWLILSEGNQDEVKLTMKLNAPENKSG